jgi:hypothetical protein
VSPRALTHCVIVGIVLALVAYDVAIYRVDPNATITKVSRDILIWHPYVPLILGMFLQHLLER